MPEVFVAMGSNIKPAHNLRVGLSELEERFGALCMSPVYRNRAVGFDGDDFYNLVVGFDTSEEVQAVARILESIEERCGRDREVPKFGPRTLDLDLLLYGDNAIDMQSLHLPRKDILKYAFVLCPVADIAPDRRHPVNGRSFAELWAGFDQANHPLEEVSLFDDSCSEGRIR